MAYDMKKRGALHCGLWTSGLPRCVVLQMVKNVSEDCIASIFRVEVSPWYPSHHICSFFRIISWVENPWTSLVTMSTSLTMVTMFKLITMLSRAIPSQPRNHLGGILLGDVTNQPTKSQIPRSRKCHRPQVSLTSLPRFAKSNSGENSTTVTLCIHFITCSFMNPLICSFFQRALTISTHSMHIKMQKMDIQKGYFYACMYFGCGT
jgi:hypothetical protein